MPADSLNIHLIFTLLNYRVSYHWPDTLVFDLDLLSMIPEREIYNVRN